jgi:dienelactone hydrolase
MSLLPLFRATTLGAMRLRQPGPPITNTQRFGCASCRWGRRFGWMVTTSEVEYEADGGVLMIGHLAVPADDAGAALPAVLVAHEAPGLDDVHRERADRLAERGYVAFALDAHGGGRFRLDDPRIRERVAAISNDPDRARSIAASGLEVVRVHRRVDASRMAAIGYCFGGTLVLELARGGTDLRAVVGFHPGLGTSRPETPATSPARCWSASAQRTPTWTATRVPRSRPRCGPATSTGACTSTAECSTASPTRTQTGPVSPGSPTTRRPPTGPGGPCSTCSRRSSGRKPLPLIREQRIEATAPKPSLRRERRVPAKRLT